MLKKIRRKKRKREEEEEVKEDAEEAIRELEDAELLKDAMWISIGESINVSGTTIESMLDNIKQLLDNCTITEEEVYPLFPRPAFLNEGSSHNRCFRKLYGIKRHIINGYVREL